MAMDGEGRLTDAQLIEQLRARVRQLEATQTPAVGVDVSDEMVERACDAWDKHLPDEPICHNGAMRAALNAALRTGGGG